MGVPSRSWSMPAVQETVHRGEVLVGIARLPPRELHGLPVRCANPPKVVWLPGVRVEDDAPKLQETLYPPEAPRRIENQG